MCSVVGCNSSRRRAQRFKLPEDPEKRLEWVQFLFEVNGQRLKESSWTDITICREHFKGDCFVQLTGTGSVQLMPDAVPSLGPQAEPVEPEPSVETPQREKVRHCPPASAGPPSNPSKLRAKHGSCSVVDCKDQHKALHRPPASEDRRAEWIKFIYDGNVPATITKNLYVCARHFVSESFTNLGQYNAGLAAKLYLKDGAVPTVRDKPADRSQGSPPPQLSMAHHVACQTDPPERCTVATQLSLKTLQPHFRSKGVQTQTITRSHVGVGTSTVAFTASQPFLTSTQTKRPCKRPRLELEEEEEEEEDEDEDENTLDGSSFIQDSTCDPADSESAPLIEEPSRPVHKTPTYIVYENCLLELFEVCPVCQRVSDVQTRRLGTFVSVEQQCPQCQFSRKWNSQPILGSTPAGNLQLSAAVYATGASYSKLKEIFRLMRLKMVQRHTFETLARMYIEPAIVHRWKTAQDRMVEQLSQQQNVILGGDLKASSLGSSAKFGCYTMMDLKSNTVVDLQLIQSSEVGGSHHMEKEGLKKSLALLEACGVTVESIVTDRHPQILKFMGERNITQYYDVCHLAKGLSKKLVKISHSKECHQLKKWLPSIKNHMYWTAASSTSAPERVSKWTSILNHVQDIHTHDDPVFPQCLHPERTSTDKSRWLTAGTPAFYRLEKVIKNKRVLEDVEKLSPHSNASSLVDFQSVIRRFAPKNARFPFLGTLCRLYLAALHFNENAGHPQSPSSAAEPLFGDDSRAAKKGDDTATPEKAEPTFQYQDELLDCIFEVVFEDPAPYVDEVLEIPIPEDCSVQSDRRRKQKVMVNYASRFSQRQEPVDTTELVRQRDQVEPCDSPTSSSEESRRAVTASQEGPDPGDESCSAAPSAACVTVNTQMQPKNPDLIKEKAALLKNQGKYVVNEKRLLQLFRCKCLSCGSKLLMEKVTRGVLMILNQQCLQCGFRHQWKSLADATIPTAEDEHLTGDAEVTLEALPGDDMHSSITGVPEIVAVIDEESDPDTDDISDPGDVDSDEDWKPLRILTARVLHKKPDKNSRDEGDEADFPPIPVKHGKLCAECGMFFGKRKRHVCEHKAKPYSCNICGKRCVSEIALNAHSRIHNENYEHRCKYCHVTFKTKVDKSTHEQTHLTEGKPYKCPDCSETFASNKERKIHLEDHRGPRQLKCHICGIDFLWPLSLQRHLAVHTGEKAFKCSVCQRGFNQASHLKSHMRLHTGERPYRCQYCDTRFNHNVSLKSHILRHHTSSSGAEKMNEREGDAGDAQGHDSSRGTDSGLDYVEEEQDTEERIHGPKKKRRSTGRPRGRPKSFGPSNLVLATEVEGEGSHLKRTRCSDEESEDEPTDSDASSDSAEAEEEKAIKSTVRSRGRPKDSDSDSDFDPVEGKKRRCSSTSVGKRRGRH